MEGEHHAASRMMEFKASGPLTLTLMGWPAAPEGTTTVQWRNVRGVLASVVFQPTIAASAFTAWDRRPSRIGRRREGVSSY
jgi:hypothetical protein